MHINAMVDDCAEDTKSWFPHVYGDRVSSLVHHALGLCGEAGEFANIVKKIDRGDLPFAGTAQDSLQEELVDVLIYVCTLADILGMNLAEGYNRKKDINRRRFGANSNHPAH
jgi:NTP pyrophosphatase (non-canonical NTP hydrolase)